MAAQPAVLMVIGAWHIPEHYAALTDLLTAAGFLTVCPRYPTATNTRPPPYGLAEDTAAIREVATSLADKGHPILVLMHSYGGTVGTNALRDLAFTQRQAQGKPGGVVHLLYISAFLLRVGERPVDAFGGEAPSVLKEHPDGALELLNPADVLYNDLSAAEREHWTAMLVGAPSKPLRTPLEYAAYEDIDATYLVCENDQAIPAAGQRAMARLLAKHGEPCIEVCDASHSPFLSMPGTVVEVVKRCWTSTGLPLP